MSTGVLSGTGPLLTTDHVSNGSFPVISCQPVCWFLCEVIHFESRNSQEPYYLPLDVGEDTQDRESWVWVQLYHVVAMSLWPNFFASKALASSPNIWERSSFFHKTHRAVKRKRQNHTFEGARS